MCVAFLAFCNGLVLCVFRVVCFFLGGGRCVYARCFDVCAVFGLAAWFV